MSPWGVRQGLLVVAILALTLTGAAAAADGGEARGIDPNQGDNLVEVTLPDKAAAIQLQLNAEQYGVDFNDHYLRHNGNGSVTVTVFGTAEELDALAAAGYEVGTTIEGPTTWRTRVQERQEDVRAEVRADAAARGAGDVSAADTGEIVVLRVDSFENYAGRFISVEAKTRLGGVQADGTGYEGPSLSLTWNRGAGTDDAAAADAGRDRLEQGCGQGSARPALAGRGPAADERRLPERLHDA